MTGFPRKKFSEIAKEEFDPKSDQEFFQDRLYRMVDYAVGRHDWYEEQRGKLFQAALGMISFIAAAIAITTSFNDHSRVFVVTFYLGLISLGYAACRIIFLYTKVSEKNHPYRRAADIKSWYYRYAFESGSVIDDLDELFASEDKDRAVEDTRENFRSFLRKIDQKSIKDSAIHEDLQQVFILYLLQNYRQINLKEMYRVVRVWTIISAALFGTSLLSLITCPALELIYVVFSHIKVGG